MTNASAVQEAFEARYTLPPIEDIADTRGGNSQEAGARPRSSAPSATPILLAHHYQRPEVQEVADAVADSLKLSQAAAKTNADVIVFCGVHFMAETAAILLPGKNRPAAGPARGMFARRCRSRRRSCASGRPSCPAAVVVAYINTSAAVKAESDYCCTSANAAKVVARDSRGPADSFPPRQISGDGRRAPDRTQQHRRLSRLLPRSQDDPARAGGRNDGRASRHRAAAASRVRLRQLLHGQGARRHAARRTAPSSFRPKECCGTSANLAGKRIRRRHRARHHAPAQ